MILPTAAPPHCYLYSHSAYQVPRGLTYRCRILIYSEYNDVDDR